MAPLTPGTAVGLALVLPAGYPSWLERLSPQQNTRSSPAIAQMWLSPTLTCFGLGTPLIARGVAVNGTVALETAS